MAYVAVKGGQDAISASNKLIEYARVKDQKLVDVKTIKFAFKDLVDQVMSEASLYDRDLAALAIKQARASMEEAVFLLRAHRSTLPRLYYSTITEPNDMEIERRITASFKDISGGQFLGQARDYEQRFLNFDLVDETKEDLEEIKKTYEEEPVQESGEDLSSLKKVVDYLESVGLFTRKEKDDREPDDITKKAIEFPASRSEKLQSLTRGQTGAVTSLGYAVIRGFGIGGHPNIGELRVGDMDIHVDIRDLENEDDYYYIGSIEVTEVETFHQSDVDSGEDESKKLDFDIGYGLVYGQNETKAIAMACLDYSLKYKGPDYRPTSDDEFVLLHIDAVESSGFISHLKLPHYVTFQSVLDSIRKINKEGDKDED